MKQQLSHLQAQITQAYSPAKELQASVYSPRKNRIDPQQYIGAYQAQKKSQVSNWSPVLNESLNNGSRHHPRQTTPNSQIHLIALGSIAKKMSSSHIEDVVQRAQNRLCAKDKPSKNSISVDENTFVCEAEKGPIPQSSSKKSETHQQSPQKPQNIFRKQQQLSQEKVHQFYSTPQGTQPLSARFAEEVESSDCIFKAQLPSSQKKNSERTVKQIYSQNDPNGQEMVEPEGVKTAPNSTTHVRRKPTQGFLTQNTAIQQDRQKVRSSQQFQVQPHILDYQTSNQKNSTEKIQKTTEVYKEIPPLQKAPSFLISPRKTNVLAKPHPKLTLQHTRKQSFATASTAMNTISQNLPASQDLIRAINKTTLADTFLQTISTQESKRSKSKKQKTKTISKINDESSGFRNSLMFKTSTGLDQAYSDAPTSLFKNTVNQPKMITQTTFKTNQNPNEKKGKALILPVASQREASRQRPATTQTLAVVKKKVQVDLPLQTKENGWGMLDSERQLFGDRCPKGFQKIGFLGKGGIAVVWLCLNEKQQKVAVKQFPKKQTKSVDNSAKVEIKIYNKLYSGQTNHIGLNSVAKLLQVVDESKDSWLVYEVGKQALGSLMFDVKGEFFRGERIYNVLHKDFFNALSQDFAILKDFLRLMAEVLDSLQEKKVVHADLKPDNILIEITGRRITSLKLIDFGSSFSFEETTSITATTPEYLAPEVLLFLENRGAANQNSTQASLFKIQRPWSYDMWSLGAILLEILSGIPIWMSLKCRTIPQKGEKQTITTGIFGVQGRSQQKILLKQQALLHNLPKSLQKFECYGLSDDYKFVDLLGRILNPDPQQRISPKEILFHPFLQ